MLRISLPNGCYCSNLSVHPKNWKTANASTREQWYIHYRFYDPSGSLPNQPIKCKQVFIKGMNSYKTVAERRDATEALLEDELQLLRDEGYNPITNIKVPEPLTNDTEINPDTRFIIALNIVNERLNVENSTRRNIKHMINTVAVAAKQLNLNSYVIGNISRKNIRAILEKCRVLKGKKWSVNQFNVFRAYLMMLFKELVELEAIDSNPIREIAKQKSVKKMRRTLKDDPESRKLISDHLKNSHYSFWRFLQIFFHSGCRETELMQVKKTSVDLKKQRFKITVKKRKHQREEWRVIKDTALSFWWEVYNLAEDDQYLFSKGLIPGNAPINAIQISRRWRIHVKKKLGVTVDFYSLKHLNLDQTSAVLSAEYASKMAGHTTPVITMQHYLVGEKERQDELLKKVNNSFS